jgi:hypothetical protein
VKKRLSRARQDKIDTVQRTAPGIAEAVAKSAGSIGAAKLVAFAAGALIGTVGGAVALLPHGWLSRIMRRHWGYGRRCGIPLTVAVA